MICPFGLATQLFGVARFYRKGALYGKVKVKGIAKD